jgi:hypothetical protein
MQYESRGEEEKATTIYPPSETMLGFYSEVQGMNCEGLEEGYLVR